jgi:hypothetical protein
VKAAADVPLCCACTECAKGTVAAEEEAPQCTACAAGQHSAGVLQCSYTAATPQAPRACWAPCSALPPLALVGRPPLGCRLPANHSPQAPTNHPPFSGALLCRGCPGGRFNPLPAQTSCVGCAAGRAGDYGYSQQSARHCRVCALGRFGLGAPAALGAPAPRCERCAAGRFGVAKGAGRCVRCPPSGARMRPLVRSQCQHSPPAAAPTPTPPTPAPFAVAALAPAGARLPPCNTH